MDINPEGSRRTLANYIDRLPHRCHAEDHSCEEKAGVQERLLLTLEEGSEYESVKDAVSSTLKLAHKLVCLAFHDFESLLKLKHTIDSIKKLAVGLRSAEEKAEGYSIANYSTYLFAFQQYFHSAYRAQQGKVLERVLRNFIAEHFANLNPEDKIKYSELVKRLTGKELGSGEIKYDLDLVLSKKDGYMVIQIRSRDDTGGTTAKRSLSAPLKNMLDKSEDRVLRRNLDYIIYVWEPLEQSQKGALVRNTLSELGFSLERKEVQELERRLLSGSREQVYGNAFLRIAYGSDELIETLCLHEGCDDQKRNSLKNELEGTIKKLGRWDDLWLTYAIVSIELENYVLRGKQNFSLLESKLDELGISIGECDLMNYRCKSAEYAHQLIGRWKEDLPVTSPSDVLNYIRDLVLLKMMYRKIAGACPELVKDIR